MFKKNQYAFQKVSVALVRLYFYYIFAGGSLPDKLDRHPWYLDFPRWHDTRKGNSDRTFASAAQLKAATMQYDVSLLNIKLHFLSTPRCQINESTRLSFLDFSPTLCLDMSYLISHPTRLFGSTHFAFPPYSYIWPYSLNWRLRVS